MYKYRTPFRLTDPVILFDDAKEYLSDAKDEMLQCLKEDDRIPEEVRDTIISINWKLRSSKGGIIEVVSTKDLCPLELKYISTFIDGQNSDGLGAGFSDQDFACYETESGNFISASFYSGDCKLDYVGEV